MAPSDTSRNGSTRPGAKKPSGSGKAGAGAGASYPSPSSAAGSTAVVRFGNGGSSEASQPAKFVRKPSLKSSNSIGRGEKPGPRQAALKGPAGKPATGQLRNNGKRVSTGSASTAALVGRTGLSASRPTGQSVASAKLDALMTPEQKMAKLTQKERKQQELMERINRRVGRTSMYIGNQDSEGTFDVAKVARNVWNRLTMGGNASQNNSLLAAAHAAAAAEEDSAKDDNGEDEIQEDGEDGQGTASERGRRLARSKSVFEVDPDHQMAEVLNSLNTKRFWGALRFLCIKLISSPDFELLVIIFIFANCISLALLKPQEGEDSPWNTTLDKVELGLNACFTAELFIRIVAVGGILRFLSYPWNLFDATMVSVGYTQFLPTTGSGSGSFRALRAIRALRPLRTITRFNSLRAVVVCFMEALPLLISVATMLLFFLFLFAICGVQLFGEVYHWGCQDYLTGYMEEGNSMPGSAGCSSRSCPTDTEYNYTCIFTEEGQQFNIAGYDNVGTAMLTAFQITTLSNWNYIMYRTIDVSGSAAVLYYVVLILMGTYYILILFLAVLKTKFGKAQDLFATVAPQESAPGNDNTVVKAYKGLKSGFIAVASKFYHPKADSDDGDDGISCYSEVISEYDDEANSGATGFARSAFFATRPLVKPDKWHKFPKYWWKVMERSMFQLVTHKRFNHFFLLCILLNTLLLAVEYNGMPTKMEEFLTVANFILTQIFTVEVVCKLLGLGLSEFFSDNFNIFDLAVVILSQVEIILVNAQAGQMSGAGALRSLKTLRVLKSFRVLRVFKMFRYLDSLRKIGEVLLNSMSSFISIGALTLLFNVVFSIMGLHVYGQYNTDIGYPNFHTFLNSCVLVFQVLTLEDWDVIAYAYVRETNYSAMGFFVAWIVVGKYIFLTLFLAVTLEAFESKYDTDAAQEVADVVWDEMDGSDEGIDDGSGDASSYRAAEGHAEMSNRRGTIEAFLQDDNSEQPSAFDHESGTLLSIPTSQMQGRTDMDIRQSVDIWRREAPPQSSTSLATSEGGESVHLLGVGSAFDTLTKPWSAQGPDDVAPITITQSRLTADDKNTEDLVWSIEGCALDEVADEMGIGMVPGMVEPDPGRPMAPAARQRPRNVSPEIQPGVPGAVAEAVEDEDEDEKAALISPHVSKRSKRSKTKRRREKEKLDVVDEETARKESERLQAEILEARELMGEQLPDGEEGQVATNGDCPPLEGRSLMLFSHTNPLRVALYQLVTNKRFDYTMFFFIIISCAAMVYEHPFVAHGSLEYQVLQYFEITLTAIFTMEAVFKILAFGFLPFVKSITNCIDLAIVVTSILLLALESVASDLQAIKGLRVLRAAKPLRTLTRSKGMMLVFKSLSMSLMSMANVSVICLLFFAIFAILGVQLFGGDFYHCSQPRTIDGTLVDAKADCVGLGEDGEPLEWLNNYLNFDHLGNALITLFITSTLDGYADTMMLAMSVRGKDLQPMPGANAGAFLFFCIFIMVCAFCLLNLYVGVVFYQFSRIRMLSHAGSAFLTTSQQEWCELSKMVFKLEPLEKVAAPTDRLRAWCSRMCLAPHFDTVMTMVIVVNVCFMATEHFNMSQTFLDISKYSNYVFTTIFVGELLTKMLGMGWKRYWRNGWNKFDFFVVLASIVDLAVSFLEAQFMRVLRVLRVQKLLRLLRISRIIKLVKGLKGLRSLFSTLLVSLPAFWNVGALLMLVLFIYAYVGVLLFGTVRISEGLTHNANFTRFWLALNVLVRVATNDDWYLVMQDCSAVPPACSYELSDCGSPVAQLYFSSFVGFVSIIMLNLFTAVIIENFEKQQEQDSWKIMPTALEEFRELWADYDDGSGTVTPRDLHDLLTRVNPPLGLGLTTTNAELVRFVASMDIPLKNGRVPFQRTVFELVRRVSETEIPEGQMKAGLDQLVSTAFTGMEEDEMMSFQVALVVTRLQRKWRARCSSMKMKRVIQKRLERSQAVPSFTSLLQQKQDWATEVECLHMDGKPWRFDAAAGLGALTDWAFGQPVVQQPSSPRVGGLGRRVTHIIGGGFRSFYAASGVSQVTTASDKERTTFASRFGGLVHHMTHYKTAPMESTKAQVEPILSAKGEEITKLEQMAEEALRLAMIDSDEDEDSDYESHSNRLLTFGGPRDVAP